MRIFKLLFLLFSLVTTSYAEIVYPHNDPFKNVKQEILDVMSDIAGPNGSSQIVLDSEKIFLWNNDIDMIPSFTAVTDSNRNLIHQEIQKVCECEILASKVGGIIKVGVDNAATMFFRRGWQQYLGDEVDGDVPPIVIIYHEFSHAKDYLLNSERFFDMSIIPDKQWKNKAEQSAVEQQNDFVHFYGFYEGVHFKRRSSYGRNTLYKVEHYLSF